MRQIIHYAEGIGRSLPMRFRTANEYSVKKIIKMKQKESNARISIRTIIVPMSVVCLCNSPREEKLTEQPTFFLLPRRCSDDSVSFNSVVIGVVVRIESIA